MSKRRSQKGDEDADISPQQIIDATATDIFSLAIPKHWAKGTLIPDFRKDYHLELRDGLVPNGVSFLVQQKGQLRVEIKKQGAKFKGLKKKDLRYWSKQRRPVFLVVIDVTAGQGYWVFIQQFIKKELVGKKLSGDGELTIYLPLDQKLHDSQKLESAIKAADVYMAGEHPRAVESGLRAHREKWEKLDHRFLVVPSATENSIRLDFIPKEPVLFKMRFMGDDEKRGKEIFSEFFGKGKEIVVHPGEIEILGSPLMAKAFETSVAMKSTHRMDMHVEIVADYPSGSNTRIPLSNAFVEGGFEELRLSADLPRSVLTFKATMPTGGKGHIFLNYDFDKWAGQPLLNLPYFDQLRNIYKCLAEQGDVHIIGSVDGVQVFAETISGFPSQEQRASSLILEVLDKARQLARRYNVNPPFPPKLIVEELEKLDEVYGELEPGPVSASDFDISGMSPRDMLKKFTILSETDAGGGTLWIHNPDAEFDLFGQRVVLPEHLVTITSVVPSVKNLKHELSKKSDEKVLVQWRGTPISVRTVRSPTPEESESFAKGQRTDVIEV